VLTRNIVFSPVSDGEESGATTYECRAIVALNTLLVHVDSGVTLVPKPNFQTSGFMLPVTDQEGIVWSDGMGNYLTTENGYHTHTYRIDLEFKDPITEWWIGYKSIADLVVPTGAGDLDLDMAFQLNTTEYDHA
jgi:hypothetical protein